MKKEQIKETRKLIFELAGNEKRRRFGKSKLTENEKRGLMFDATRYKPLLELNYTEIYLIVQNYDYERTEGDDTTTPTEVRRLILRYLENEKRRRYRRNVKLTEDEIKAFLKIMKRDYAIEDLTYIRILSMNRMITEFLYTMGYGASNIWGY